jgi:DNA-directed RNA polymerase specialized sigma24 family protein
MVRKYAFNPAHHKKMSRTSESATPVRKGEVDRWEKPMDDGQSTHSPVMPETSGQRVKIQRLNQIGSAEMRGGAFMDAVTSPRDASQPELVAAIVQLTAGEKIAIMKIARLYARGTPFDHDDLVHEAFARVLEGRRIWPGHLPAVRFFGGVLRSIAWEWRRERHGEVPPVETATPAGGPDAALDAAKIVSLFDDDPVAKRVVLAMMEGARGEELQAVSGLNRTEYQSKRTKIRRRIDKFFDGER